MKVHPAFEQQLAVVEQQLDQLSDALLGSDTARLEACAHAVRDAMALLAQLQARGGLQGAPEGELARRFQDVAARVGVLRESLVRMSSLAERSLASVLPGAPAGGTTYDKSLGRTASSALSRAYKA